MNETKIGQANRTEQADVAPSGRADLFMQSESPEVQFALLKQKLREDIKNSAGSVRYVDSELHLRHGNRARKLNRSPNRNNFGASEVQSTTLDVGFNSGRLQQDKFHDNISSAIPFNATNASTTLTTTTRDTPTGSGTRLLQYGESSSGDQQNVGQTNHSKHDKDSPSHSNNCQVCLIKGVSEDLRNIEKLVQERNEQISKLRARYLRSYFERQMMD